MMFLPSACTGAADSSIWSQSLACERRSVTLPCYCSKHVSRWGGVGGGYKGPATPTYQVEVGGISEKNRKPTVNNDTVVGK